MPREFSRSDRIASQVQREMAELIRLHVKDPDLGMITVSDAEVSRDLAVAKIYVSFLGAHVPAERAIQRLTTHVPELRRELGKRLRVRSLPEVRFVHDDSIERGLRMDDLLNKISHENPAEGRDS